VPENFAIHVGSESRTVTALARRLIDNRAANCFSSSFQFAICAPIKKRTAGITHGMFARRLGWPGFEFMAVSVWALLEAASILAF
jgi:hypothetical protein